MSDTIENQDPNGLEQGTYEIIRSRLDKYGADLKSRLESLNERRKEIFGSVDTALIATEHITTLNSCVPRDMVSIGNYFLFGYNVHIGLKTETSLDDVFGVFEYTDRSLKSVPSTLLSDETFEKDFKNLYKYYRGSTFSKFILKNGYLYLVFQIGKSLTDIKTFKFIINRDNTLKYLDSRSEHEVKLPEQHGFDWKRPTADHFRHGLHPHISIEDIVFVETVGGDLTIKIEDNTSSGFGIYAEPVENVDQTLNDADIAYAIIGDLVVMKILPYQEKEYRYILYNHKVKQALRIDALKEACILLPEGQGVIFPQGYYLQSGDYKLFDFAYEGLGFEKCIPASNGEDFMYTFYNPAEGIYTLLVYNIIEQVMDSPIHCHGYSIFANGEMCLFRSEEVAQKHHSIQIWETPFSFEDQIKDEKKDAYLYKVGNRAVVSAMAECRSILKLINREDPYGTLYVDLSKSARVTLDAYHWISHQEAMQLSEPLEHIEKTAISAIAEFDKVNNLKSKALEHLNGLREKMVEVRRKAKAGTYTTVEHYVETLTQLRQLRGELISAKEIRYMETERVNEMETEILELQGKYAEECVQFLLSDGALDSYDQKVDVIEKNLVAITKVIEADALDKEIASVSGELEMLIDIVNGLEINDSTVTTKIIDNITEIFYRFNRIIADLKKKRKSIFGAESETEFKSQLKLIQQGAANYINLSDTPNKCDEYLNRLIIQLEELEGKFADFPEFGVAMVEVREEVLNAFESHKLALIEARNNKAVAIQRSAERIIQGIENRLKQLKSADEINAYLASDALVQKVRETIKKLLELDDSVKADELNSQLKALRENALRQLRDKKELFTEGENIIKLGNHHFSVNEKKLGVTLVQRDDAMFYHLTGTNFFEELVDEDFMHTKPFWKQEIVSESSEVYRGEYLAYLMFSTLIKSKHCQCGEEVLTLSKANSMSAAELTPYVQRFMNPRFDERYVKGIHDVDAASILHVLLKINGSADLLIFSPELRAEARFLWNFLLTDEERRDWNKRLKAHGLLQTAFESLDVSSEVQAELCAFIEPKLSTKNVYRIATYLFLELGTSDQFVSSPEGAELKAAFEKWVKQNKLQKKLATSLDELKDTPKYQLQLVKEWLKRFIDSSELSEFQPVIAEAAVSLLSNAHAQEQLVEVNLKAVVSEMIGEHPRIKDGNLALNYHAWTEHLAYFHTEWVPAYRAYVELKHQKIEQFKETIKLHSFEPKTMTSFVRNRLIDEVYLPLIGNNMAKQMGVVGEEKRTDLMGMLLLISPPGYGKTTLMEYLAQRIGLIFVKINGPALGHTVTSVDPLSAPNSAAREELNRLNLAFEMGDNVMLYIDDIQHCHPEFLQKFISLCDGQRKIEGVYKGKTKTYDFRGRKMMVVMAGNPYTESGERFQIPDMLANRSDIYNLGDVIGGKRDVFNLSYVENCLTSNPLLNALNNKSFRDVRTLIKVAAEGAQESIDLEANYSNDEVEEYVGLISQVLKVRDIVSQVNAEYIQSASMEDQYSVAPAFRLQGSYRDMNKIVEKLVGMMNTEELNTLILSHYESESQTLTSGAEANLLRFKELFNALSETEQQRWEDIKTTYRSNKKETNGNVITPLIEQMRMISDALTTMSRSMNKTGNDKDEK